MVDKFRDRGIRFEEHQTVTGTITDERVSGTIRARTIAIRPNGSERAAPPHPALERRQLGDALTASTRGGLSGFSFVSSGSAGPSPSLPSDHYPDSADAINAIPVSRTTMPPT